MSAFLGPIHHWLFRKIKLQNAIIERILKDNPEDKETLEATYGVFPDGALEDIIDGSNIHGWLQGYVSQVEYKLAASVTKLVGQNSMLYDDMKSIFYEAGKEISDEIASKNASEIYKVISDSLLDGMPCDNAYTVLEDNQDSVVWRRNNCVHSVYWNEVGGNVENYYELREEFTKGILAQTKLKYEKVDDRTFVIS